VDNPCALLDQENSKSFISGDTEAKYNFFLVRLNSYHCDRCTSGIESVPQALARHVNVTL
jgi:hypothetical protein